MAEKPTPEQDTQRYYELEEELKQLAEQSSQLIIRGNEIALECSIIRRRNFAGKVPPRPEQQPPNGKTNDTEPSHRGPEGTTG